MINDKTTENIVHTSIWNPSAAIFWSILFTPVFGAWIHAKNWAMIGEDKKYKQSMYWVYGGLFVLLLIPFLPNTSGGYEFSFLLAWYFILARIQVRYIKEKKYVTYKKNGWGKVIGLASVGLVLYVISSLFITNFEVKIQNKLTLADISGVWVSDFDRKLFIFKLIGKNKSIIIDGKRYSVKVRNFEEESDITNFFINSNHSVIWSIRQNYDEEGAFTLDITLDDGTQNSLSYVRGL